MLLRIWKRKALSITLKLTSDLSRLDIDFEELREERRVDFERADFATSIYAWLMEKTDARYSADKDPRNIEFLDTILARWPSAKVIHIYRDPRDVLASKQKAAWSRGRNIYFHLAAGAAQFDLAMRFQNQFGNHRIMPVQYEHLLTDTAGTLKQICKWLGIDFESQMLEFGTTAAALTSSDEMQWKKETLGTAAQKKLWQLETVAWTI